MSHGRIWVSSIVEQVRQVVDSPVLASILGIGWIPIALTVAAIDVLEATPLFVVTQSLAALMVVFGPFDVWYYDERLLPGFFDRASEIVAPGQDELLREMATKYERRFARYWWVVVVPWTALVLMVFFVSDGYLASQGITSPVAYWSYFGFFTYWGIFSGLGFHGGITTVLAIREFAETVELSIDPLHPDGLGGLSQIGHFAIRTTLILSTGALALPLSFQLAAEIGLSEPVYLGVGLYVVLIAGIFLYPTFRVNQRAQALRESILDEYRTRIREMESRLDDQMEEVESDAALRENQTLQMEIQRVRREFGDYRNVQLYPLSIGILIQLLSSLLLPILFILFEMMLAQYL